MIERLALLSFRHRWLTLSVWVVILLGAVGAASAFSGDFADGGRLRGTDSDAAYQVIGSEFPPEAGDTVTVAYRAPNGIQRPLAVAVMDRFIASARTVPNVRAVEAPSQISPDGLVGVGSLVLTGTPEQQSVAAQQLRQRATSIGDTEMRIDFNSFQFAEGGLNSTGEIAGVIGAFVILLLAFGSVVTMGVPIISALVGVAVAASGVGLWAAAVPTPDFTTEVALMIGIGVGIDYALFIITRYRSALINRCSPQQAIAEAMGSAGRAVVFAGSIVMVSLLGMMLMRMPFLYGLALGSATSVLVAVLAALTLVPALLSIMGRRVGARAVRVAHSTRETRWHRWARFVQRRAAISAVLGTVVLLSLSLPVLWMHLAHADAGSDAKGSTTRLAHDELARAFGPGVNGPLVLAVTGRSSEANLQRIRTLVAHTDGVASVSEPTLSSSGNAALFTVTPTTGPQESATAALVHHLRTEFRDNSLLVHVGGVTASDIDFAALMGGRLPLFIGAVLVVSFILLMLVFRSVLVPLKAVVLNLLSIGAAYGLMVAVFQWGWLAGLVGVQQGAPIESWAPMMLFAIVFGLSMDYEVFLLSSVHERYQATRDNSASVVDGLAVTARVITAAAAIMVLVFGGFVVNDVRSIKLIGFGLASAVLVDATIVRMLLVPATMQLLGDRNWWMPTWLDRLLPRLDVERRLDHGGSVGPAGSLGIRTGSRRRMRA